MRQIYSERLEVVPISWCLTATIRQACPISKIKVSDYKLESSFVTAFPRQRVVSIHRIRKYGKLNFSRYALVRVWTLYDTDVGATKS